LQSTLIKRYIEDHLLNSPTSIFDTVISLVKGIEILAYKITLLTTKIQILRKANEALSKRRRAKKTRIQQGDIFTKEEATEILDKREAEKQVELDKYIKRGTQNVEQSTIKCYSSCKLLDHNTQTYQRDI